MVGSKGEVSRRMVQPQGETMRAPDEVAAMVRLRALGWGVRRIAAELGCSHMTVRRYLAEGGWAAYRTPRRAKALDGLEDWLAERSRRHRGNADVVGIFPCEASITRLIGAVLLEQNDEWQLQHRYMQVEAMAELMPPIIEGETESLPPPARIPSQAA